MDWSSAAFLNQKFPHGLCSVRRKSQSSTAKAITVSSQTWTLRSTLLKTSVKLLMRRPNSVWRRWRSCWLTNELLCMSNHSVTVFDTFLLLLYDDIKGSSVWRSRAVLRHTGPSGLYMERPSATSYTLLNHLLLEYVSEEQEVELGASGVSNLILLATWVKLLEIGCADETDKEGILMLLRETVHLSGHAEMDLSLTLAK